MAFTEEISYAGKKSTDSSSGQLRFEQDNNRLVLFDGTVNRMVIGLYNGQVLIAISKVGEDVFAALDA